MKKILLATSALVAMSTVAVAGDIPAAPMAPVPAGFTVTATGEVVVYGYSNITTSTGGIGGQYNGTLTAAKTLDNGADVSLALTLDSTATNNISAVLHYGSSMGTVDAGHIDMDDYDVDLPDVPGAPGLQDEDDAMTFAEFAATPVALAAPVFGAGTVAIAYVSPEFGGFKLGLAVDSTNAYDIAVAGSTSAGGATVSAGVSYTGADYTTMGTTGTIDAAVAVESNGFSVGGSYQNIIAGANSYSVGASYTMAPFTVGADFDGTTANMGVAYDADGTTAVLAAAYDTGTSAFTTVTAGATASMGIASVNIRETYTITGGNLLSEIGISAALAGGVTAGATIVHNSVAATLTGTAGVDYALNSNVTVGAGVSYSAAATLVAAGVKVSF
ncbi:MAG: porin [Rhizobiales bacterium]|nr:porin [Hyphomicrobiales bacterium]NRB15185.1 porin [Hyphomicrobiales bacterium]